MKRLTISKLSIHPGFIFTLFAFVFAESSVFSLCVIICAVFHELGHFFVAKLLGHKISSFELAPFGAVMSIDGNISYISETYIALAGPIFSFLLAALIFPFYLISPSAFLLFMVFCSLSLGVFNLIPLRTFDGGRILRGILFSNFEYEKALSLSRASELPILLILSCISVWMVIFCSYNFSLCFICLYIFISAYKNES